MLPRIVAVLRDPTREGFVTRPRHPCKSRRSPHLRIIFAIKDLFCATYGGFAVTQASISDSTAHSMNSLSRTWMAEELIHIDDQHKFYKFINNDNAAPTLWLRLILPSRPSLNFCVFFSRFSAGRPMALCISRIYKVNIYLPFTLISG